MTNENMIPERFYFHGNEIEQFTHIQVPIALIKDKVFKDISTDAKLLYGLLLNRTGLSIKNHWLDGDNRTYITYTIENVREDLGIGSTKAKKLFAELGDINDTGIGLIKKVRVLNKPSRIYVLNFIEVYTYLISICGSAEKKPEKELYGVEYRLELEAYKKACTRIESLKLPDGSFPTEENIIQSIADTEEKISEYTGKRKELEKELRNLSQLKENIDSINGDVLEEEEIEETIPMDRYSR